MSENLQFKTIHELLGEHFFIPYYQRGYRWTKHQVEDLLNDIWAFANRKNIKEKEFYCLQPVVTKEAAWEEDGAEKKGWEIIDGQQRLTTIFIILSYLTREYLKIESLEEEYGNPVYTIFYETRPDSGKFLKDLNYSMSNIDFFHMSEAYKTIADWFQSGRSVLNRTDREKFLSTILGAVNNEKSVQIIWYQVDQNASSIDLFSRLNIGKIPLTNSELIKALFLLNDKNENGLYAEISKKSMVRSVIWDEMEHKLDDKNFWAFITNEKQSVYPNKIELLFNMMAGKGKSSVDPFYTFIYFFNQAKGGEEALDELWSSIEQYYQTICEWYKNKNLYHKIGYLITIGIRLEGLISKSLTIRKDVFENYLDSLIRDSVKGDLDSLSYEKAGDYKKIERLLVLFNVESIRTNESISEYYPFGIHKATNWTLEHIHAQNSEGLDKTKREPWMAWLKSHRDLMSEIIENGREIKRKEDYQGLVNEIDQVDSDHISWEKFSSISNRIIQLFSEKEVVYEDTHSISNLALIGQADNSALNNSVFEVKRREVINMDREGKYIPIATRRVFLKYYNPDATTTHYYFWSYEDRRNYLKEIKRVLGLSNYISVDADGEDKNGNELLEHDKSI